VGFTTKKEGRGFFHPTTARLLCPRHLQEQFERNPEHFCRDVHYGNIFISHDDFPSFLYPEEEYNPEAIDENLLRGPFLLSCFRHIFTGPRTALKKSPGKSPGKKSKADLYDITKVTPENIAYTAILCRHILNSKASWATEDGGFRADVFYANIVDLFDDKEWAQDTLDWWNKWVFGDDPRVQDNSPGQRRETGVTSLAAQRAARRRNAGVRDKSSLSEAPGLNQAACANGPLSIKCELG